MPAFIRFFISKDGKANPSWEEIKADAPKENWYRLGLDKTWKYFAIVFILVILRYLNAFFAFVKEALYRLDLIMFEGEGSPISILYKGQSVIFYLNNIFFALGIGFLFYLLYLIFKK